jgi:hypothetical protein
MEAERSSERLYVGATLRAAWSVYRSQARFLVPLAFCVTLPIAVVAGLAPQKTLLVPVIFAFGATLRSPYRGMVAAMVRDVRAGRTAFSFGDLIRAPAPVLAPLIAAGVLSGLGIGIGVVLIVPGLILWVVWALIEPVIMIERVGVFDSFRRSRRLVRRNWLPVFGALFTPAVIGLLLGLAFHAAYGSLATHSARAFLVLGFGALLDPIESLVVAVLYFRLREIEQSAAPAIEAPQAPAAPAT